MNVCIHSDKEFWSVSFFFNCDGFGIKAILASKKQLGSIASSYVPGRICVKPVLFPRYLVEFISEATWA